jgi:hypothetical protein
MSLRIGEEFRIAGTAGQDWWREHGYLRTVDNGSVLTPGTADSGGGSSRRVATADGAFEMIQMLDQEQARATRIAALNDRLADLDRRSAEALRAAQKHLDEILRTANRTTDGRIVFQDEDGTIYDKDGNEVDRGDVDPDTWNPDAPSRGDFLDAREDVETAEAYREEVLDHQARLADELTDDELDALEADILALQESPPQRPEADSGPTVRTTSAAKALDELPDPAANLILQSPFSAAVAGPDDRVPDLPDGIPLPGPELLPR